MPSLDEKISQMPPIDTVTPATLLEVSKPDGMGGYVTFSARADQLGQSMGMGPWTPAFSNLSGITGSATLVKASYFCPSSSPGGIIIATAEFKVTANGSGSLMSIDLSDAVTTNFSAATQAGLMEFSIIKTSNIGIVGAIGDGWKNNLVAKIAGGIRVTFEGANISTEYLISVTWFSNIQAP